MSRDHLPVDLHLHSTASDGLFSPAQLVEKAASVGLAAVSLTDHDTMAGVEEAREAGRRRGMEVLPGVELSVITDDDKEIHLLAYDPLRPQIINDTLVQLRRERYRRMEEMVLRLQELGIGISPEEITAAAAPAAPGRLHLARLMVKGGYCSGIKKAFSQYLGRGRPAYVPRKTLNPEGAIEMLHRAGAVPVVAHPGADGKAYLHKLVSMGLRGVEVYHPDHNPELTRYYRHQAARYDLLITGGSDFHGDSSYRRGQLGGITLPYRHFKALKNAPRGFKNSSFM